MASSQTLQKAGAFSALRQFANKPKAEERCEMCGQGLIAQHQHLIEPEKRRLVCACDACAVLFTAQEGTKLRRVPRMIRFCEDFKMSEAQWGSLMIPIELVYFFYSSPEERIVALYPSAAGPIESLLSMNFWDEIANENPGLREMNPDVEALLVNRVGISRGVTPGFYIVPIDECYKLVGLIRMHWRGLSGGTEVWREIAGFFSLLRERAITTGGKPHG